MSSWIDTLWTFTNYSIHHWFWTWMNTISIHFQSTNKSLSGLWLVILKSQRHMEYNMDQYYTFSYLNFTIFKRYTHSLFIIRYLGGLVSFCCHVRLKELKKIKIKYRYYSKKTLYLNNIFTLKGILILSLLPSFDLQSTRLTHV